ncbi:MAG: 23S rRNA (pseudouridine(1915)-N(3))-methyltransferase RlmH [Clostridia bacterium]|nr:23S rRNA (pseudouridine(1915)-N(3))-methyltransferase RlmH [Clostridia bacterium]
MIKICVIAVGGIKEKEFAGAISEYEKRLGAFCDISVVEIKPAATPEDPSPAQISSALSSEARSVIAKIPKDALVFPLCIEGARMSSEDFAKQIESGANAGKSICFIIGSSHGLDGEIKRLGTKISFSDMTFPHRLFRVMLFEQIYRAFTIISGRKYHK